MTVHLLARAGVRRPVVALLAVVLAVLGLPPAPAGATALGPAQYWQHVGYSFAPCTTITWRPNLDAARQPDDMRAILAEAVDVWNEALGRTVMALGADTSTRADDRFDGTNTIEVRSSSTTGVGGVGGPSSSSRNGVDRIVEADLKIFDFDGIALSAIRDELLLTAIHEIGHGIGFLHTIDPDSPMSYVSTPGRTMDVDTAEVARFLLNAPCGSTPTVSSPYDIFGDFARDKRIDFQHVSRTVQPLLHASVDSAIDVGTALADARLREAGDVSRAVICRDDVFADCLAGSALAGSEGVVLYVPGGPDGAVPPSVFSVIDRAFGSRAAGTEVLVVGGPNAVSAHVEQELAARYPNVRRVADTSERPDRYGTAVAIATDVAGRTGDASTVLLARGDDPADAMTAGVAAARDELPLVLTPPDGLSSKTRAFLEAARPQRVVILGGPGAVGEAVEQQLRGIVPQVERVRGRERSATSVAIAQELLDYTAVETFARPLTLLNGRHEQAWNLALAYASLGAVTDSPILLTGPDGYLPSTEGGPGIAPGSGRFLAELDLAPDHDGGSFSNRDPFFQLLGTETGGYTPLQALRYADQLLLFCRWYFDDCRQEGVS